MQSLFRKYNNQLLFYIHKFNLTIPLISILNLGILLPQANLDPEAHHDGYMLAGAIAVSGGKVPNRDVFAQYGPLTPLIQGIWLRLFGNNLLNLRILTVLILSLIGILIYILALPKLGKKISFLIELAWIISYPKLPLPPALPWASTFYTLSILIVLYLYRNSAIKKFVKLNGFFCGLILSVTLLIRIQILSVILLSSLYFFWKIRIHENRLFSKYFLIGILTSQVTIWGILWKFNMLNSFILQCITWPQELYGKTYLPTNIFSKSGFIYWSTWIYYPLFYFIFTLGIKHYRKIAKIRFLIFIIIIPVSIFYSRDIYPKSYTNPVLQLQWLIQKVPLGFYYFISSFLLFYIVRNVVKRIKWKKINFEIIIGVGALLQLYPGSDPIHLWWVTPIIIIVAISLIEQHRDRDKYVGIIYYSSFPIIFLCILLLFNFLQIERINYKDSILKGMKGPVSIVSATDDTLNFLSHLGEVERVTFDCGDGLYAVAGGRYIPSGRNFVNWGPYEVGNPESGGVLFKCNTNDLEIEKTLKSGNYQLLKIISFSDNRRNAFFRRL